MSSNTTSRRRQAEAGFSLAEVLVATAIFAIIFIAALLVYDRSNRVFQHGMQSADMQQNTRIAFDRMVADLRMTGFDFDRDGLPAVSGQSQQPDEQIEYAGPSAITIRANFDYEDVATDGGRVTALETPNSQFPIVTTSNEEIVTYALVSDDASKNTDTITFYADVTDGASETRESFPGGQQEDEITITGVDLCDDGEGCVNPPYTLYRFTLGPDGTPTRMPLANNIRSLEIDYFANASGTTPLTVTDAGGGRWNPANPSASAALRGVRSQIRAFNLQLIGMNEAPDGSYTNPNETIAAVENFRTYRLESLISPRNIGKRGLAEQASAAPGQPTLDSVEFGYCGMVRLNWTQPPISNITGLPDGYAILWDTEVAGSGQPINARATGVTTSYLLDGLTPSVEYRFTIAAVNSYGTTYSDQFVVGTPKNKTKPMPPTGLEASGGGAIAVEQDAVTLTWEMPETYVPGQDLLSTAGPNGSAGTETAAIVYQEFRDIEIWRDTNVNFNPDAGEGTRVGRVSQSTSSFVDTTAAACTPYFYRIRIVEACNDDDAAFNVSSGQGRSDWHPALANGAVPGQATSEAVPAAPLTLRIDPDTSVTGCNGNFGQGSCQVTLEWPEVTTQHTTDGTEGGPIGVEQYVVEIRRNGEWFAEEPVTRTTGDFDAGLVRYSVDQLQGSSEGTTHQYEFVVRSVQLCTTEESPNSPAVQFPLCDFAAGATIEVEVDNAFTAGGGDVPWQVTAPSAIRVSTNPVTEIATATAYAYDAATGAFYSNLGTEEGVEEAVFDWPIGAQDDTVYRIDYFITDTAGCTTSGSLFLEELAVPCGLVDRFENADVYEVVDTKNIDIKLRNEFGVDTAPGADLIITGIRFEWDPAIARRQNSNDNVVSGVGFPRLGGGNNVAATRDTTLSGNNIEYWNVTSTLAAPLVSGDQTGNYQIRVSYQFNMAAAGAQPITSTTIFYRIAGVDEPGVVRECEIDP